MTENSYRIRTKVGEQPNVINVKLKQTFDTLEILSLKLSQEDTYKLYKSNYGVVVGRVLANGGVGIPNAKVSVFIESEATENNLEKILYPYTSVASKNQKGIRYNLLPDSVDDACYQNVGTFPNKRLMLDNNDVLEVFDKYYKYTTCTNQSGDYMICNIPVGAQQIHVDVDLSDIGFLSQRPRDMIYKGTPSKMFESPNKFRQDTNIDSLAQIRSQNIGVYVFPFWGDTTEDDNIAITRCDIQLDYKFEPTCVFMGATVADNDGFIGKNCGASKGQGKMADLITSQGKIEMIRKTNDGHVEEFPIMGNRLIDENGVFCYQIPMNLDYVTTDEFGNLVPTDDPSKGIPTRTSVRFRFTLDDEIGNVSKTKRCSYLVPNNPRLNSDYKYFSETRKVDYEFGSLTKDENYRDLFWNKVYTVKSFIPRLQKDDNHKSKEFTGIKWINHGGDKNRFPYNGLTIKLSFQYVLLCFLTKFIIYLISFINNVLTLLGALPCWLEKILDFEICISKWCVRPFQKFVKFMRGLIPTCIKLGSEFCDDGQNKIVFYPGCIGDCVWKHNVDEFKKTDEYNNGWEISNQPKSILNLFGVDGGTDGLSLMTCVENALIQENECTSYNFYNDWINGTLFFPKWHRYIRPKKSYFFGWFKRKAKDEWCSSDKNAELYYIQHCAVSKKPSPKECGDNCESSVENIDVKKGIVVSKQTMLEQTIYYYKAADYLDSLQEVMLFFATDIVLLGSLNDNDVDGTPQFFKNLPITTYQLPTDILDIDHHIEKVEFDENGKVHIITNADVEGSGQDWGNKNPELCGDGKTGDSGLFYGVGCSHVDMKVKSCINLRRICELGVTLDETQEIPINTMGKEDEEGDYRRLVSDGFVSWDEIYDNDSRAMFATMNHNSLKTEFNPQTGYKQYKYVYLYPINFDGALRPSMEDRLKKCDKENITYVENYKLEEESIDYTVFRMGETPYYYDGGKMPRYENSFYFYFGLTPGTTALEKFHSEYFAECENVQPIPRTPIYSFMGNKWCYDRVDVDEDGQLSKDEMNRRDGYLKLDLSKLVAPFSIQFTNSDRNDLSDLILNDIEFEKVYIGNTTEYLLNQNIISNDEAKIRNENLKGYEHLTFDKYDRIFYDSDDIEPTEYKEGDKHKNTYLYDNCTLCNGNWHLTITDGEDTVVELDVPFYTEKLKCNVLVDSFRVASNNLYQDVKHINNNNNNKPPFTPSEWWKLVSLDDLTYNENTNRKEREIGGLIIIKDIVQEQTRLTNKNVYITIESVNNILNEGYVMYDSDGNPEEPIREYDEYGNHIETYYLVNDVKYPCDPETNYVYKIDDSGNKCRPKTIYTNTNQEIKWENINETNKSTVFIQKQGIYYYIFNNQMCDENGYLYDTKIDTVNGNKKFIVDSEIGYGQDYVNGDYGFIHYDEDETDEDKERDVFYFGVPIGGQQYKITVTYKCSTDYNGDGYDDITDNTFTKIVKVNEYSPTKFYINNIDYDMIKNFKSGWDIYDTREKTKILHESAQTKNIVGWNKITDIGVQSVFTKDNLPDWEKIDLFVKYLSSSREDLVTKNNGLCPYNWTDEYIYNRAEYDELRKIIEQYYISATPKEIFNYQIASNLGENEFITSNQGFLYKKGKGDIYKLDINKGEALVFVSTGGYGNFSFYKKTDGNYTPTAVVSNTYYTTDNDQGQYLYTYISIDNNVVTDTNILEFYNYYDIIAEKIPHEQHINDDNETYYCYYLKNILIYKGNTEELIDICKITDTSTSTITPQPITIKIMCDKNGYKLSNQNIFYLNTSGVFDVLTLNEGEYKISNITIHFEKESLYVYATQEGNRYKLNNELLFSNGSVYKNTYVYYVYDYTMHNVKYFKEIPCDKQGYVYAVKYLQDKEGLMPLPYEIYDVNNLVSEDTATSTSLTEEFVVPNYVDVLCNKDGFIYAQDELKEFYLPDMNATMGGWWLGCSGNYQYNYDTGISECVPYRFYDMYNTTTKVKSDYLENIIYDTYGRYLLDEEMGIKFIEIFNDYETTENGTLRGFEYATELNGKMRLFKKAPHNNVFKQIDAQADTTDALIYMYNPNIKNPYSEERNKRGISYLCNPEGYVYETTEDRKCIAENFYKKIIECYYMDGTNKILCDEYGYIYTINNGNRIQGGPVLRYYNSYGEFEYYYYNDANGKQYKCDINGYQYKTNTQGEVEKTDIEPIKVYDNIYETKEGGNEKSYTHFKINNYYNIISDYIIINKEFIDKDNTEKVYCVDGGGNVEISFEPYQFKQLNKNIEKDAEENTIGYYYNVNDINIYNEKENVIDKNILEVIDGKVYCDVNGNVILSQLNKLEGENYVSISFEEDNGSYYYNITDIETVYNKNGIEIDKNILEVIDGKVYCDVNGNVILFKLYTYVILNKNEIKDAEGNTIEYYYDITNIEVLYEKIDENYRQIDKNLLTVNDNFKIKCGLNGKIIINFKLYKLDGDKYTQITVEQEGEKYYYNIKNITTLYSSNYKYQYFTLTYDGTIPEKRGYTIKKVYCDKYGYVYKHGNIDIDKHYQYDNYFSYTDELGYFRGDSLTNEIIQLNKVNDNTYYVYETLNGQKFKLGEEYEILKVEDSDLYYYNINNNVNFNKLISGEVVTYGSIVKLNEKGVVYLNDNNVSSDDLILKVEQINTPCDNDGYLYVTNELGEIYHPFTVKLDKDWQKYYVIDNKVVYFGVSNYIYDTYKGKKYKLNKPENVDRNKWKEFLNTYNIKLDEENYVYTTDLHSSNPTYMKIHLKRANKIYNLRIPFNTENNFVYDTKNGTKYILPYEVLEDENNIHTCTYDGKNNVPCDKDGYVYETDENNNKIKEGNVGELLDIYEYTVNDGTESFTGYYYSIGGQIKLYVDEYMIIKNTDNSGNRYKLTGLPIINKNGISYYAVIPSYTKQNDENKTDDNDEFKAYIHPILIKCDSEGYVNVDDDVYMYEEGDVENYISCYNENDGYYLDVNTNKIFCDENGNVSDLTYIGIETKQYQYKLYEFKNEYVYDTLGTIVTNVYGLRDSKSENQNCKSYIIDNFKIYCSALGYVLNVNIFDESYKLYNTTISEKSKPLNYYIIDNKKIECNEKGVISLLDNKLNIGYFIQNTNKYTINEKECDVYGYIYSINENNDKIKGINIVSKSSNKYYYLDNNDVKIPCDIDGFVYAVNGKDEPYTLNYEKTSNGFYKKTIPCDSNGYLYRYDVNNNKIKLVNKLDKELSINNIDCGNLQIYEHKYREYYEHDINSVKTIKNIYCDNEGRLLLQDEFENFLFEGLKLHKPNGIPYKLFELDHATININDKNRDYSSYLYFNYEIPNSVYVILDIQDSEQGEFITSIETNEYYYKIYCDENGVIEINDENITFPLDIIKDIQNGKFYYKLYCDENGHIIEFIENKYPENMTPIKYTKQLYCDRYGNVVNTINGKNYKFNEIFKWDNEKWVSVKNTNYIQYKVYDSTNVELDTITYTPLDGNYEKVYFLNGKVCAFDLSLPFSEENINKPYKLNSFIDKIKYVEKNYTNTKVEMWCYTIEDIDGIIHRIFYNNTTSIIKGVTFQNNRYKLDLCYTKHTNDKYYYSINTVNGETFNIECDSEGCVVEQSPLYNGEKYLKRIYTYMEKYYYYDLGKDKVYCDVKGYVIGLTPKGDGYTLNNNILLEYDSIKKNFRYKNSINSDKNLVVEDVLGKNYTFYIISSNNVYLDNDYMVSNKQKTPVVAIDGNVYIKSNEYKIENHEVKGSANYYKYNDATYCDKNGIIIENVKLKYDENTSKNINNYNILIYNSIYDCYEYKNNYGFFIPCDKEGYLYEIDNNTGKIITTSNIINKYTTFYQLNDVPCDSQGYHFEVDSNSDIIKVDITNGELVEVNIGTDTKQYYIYKHTQQVLCDKEGYLYDNYIDDDDNEFYMKKYCYKLENKELNKVIDYTLTDNEINKLIRKNSVDGKTYYSYIINNIPCDEKGFVYKTNNQGEKYTLDNTVLYNETDKYYYYNIETLCSKVGDEYYKYDIDSKGNIIKSTTVSISNGRYVTSMNIPCDSQGYVYDTDEDGYLMTLISKKHFIVYNTSKEYFEYRYVNNNNKNIQIPCDREGFIYKLKNDKPYQIKQKNNTISKIIESDYNVLNSYSYQKINGKRVKNFNELEYRNNLENVHKYIIYGENTEDEEYQLCNKDGYIIIQETKDGYKVIGNDIDGYEYSDSTKCDEFGYVYETFGDEIATQEDLLSFYKSVSDKFVEFIDNINIYIKRRIDFVKKMQELFWVTDQTEPKMLQLASKTDFTPVEYKIGYIREELVLNEKDLDNDGVIDTTDEKYEIVSSTYTFTNQNRLEVYIPTYTPSRNMDANLFVGQKFNGVLNIDDRNITPSKYKAPYIIGMRNSINNTYPPIKAQYFKIENPHYIGRELFHLHFIDKPFKLQFECMAALVDYPVLPYNAFNLFSKSRGYINMDGILYNCFIHNGSIYYDDFNKNNFHFEKQTINNTNLKIEYQYKTDEDGYVYRKVVGYENDWECEGLMSRQSEEIKTDTIAEFVCKPYIEWMLNPCLLPPTRSQLVIKDNFKTLSEIIYTNMTITVLQNNLNTDKELKYRVNNGDGNEDVYMTLYNPEYLGFADNMGEMYDEKYHLFKHNKVVTFTELLYPIVNNILSCHSYPKRDVNKTGKIASMSYVPNEDDICYTLSQLTLNQWMTNDIYILVAKTQNNCWTISKPFCKKEPLVYKVQLQLYIKKYDKNFKFASYHMSNDNEDRWWSNDNSMLLYYYAVNNMCSEYSFKKHAIHIKMPTGYTTNDKLKFVDSLSQNQYGDYNIDGSNVTYITYNEIIEALNNYSYNWTAYQYNGVYFNINDYVISEDKNKVDFTDYTVEEDPFWASDIKNNVTQLNKKLYVGIDFDNRRIQINDSITWR